MNASSRTKSGFLRFATLMTLGGVFPPLAHAGPGDLDETFGLRGVAAAPTQPKSSFSSVAMLADNRIVAADPSRIVRFNADGSVDTSFGNGTGFVDLSTLCGATQTRRCDNIFAIALQPDGKIVATVNAHRPDPTFVFGLVRFNADGSPDVSFADAGLAQTPTVDSSDFARGGLFVLPDGKLLAIGSSWTNGQSPSHPRIAFARFLPSGDPDLSFGVQGRLTTSIEVDANAVSAAQSPDGKWVVVAATPSVSAAPASLLIARFSSALEVDATFGSNGTSTYPLPASFLNPMALAVQADAKILVPGNFMGATTVLQFTVMRTLQDGQLDTSFGNGGVASVRVGEDGAFGAGKPGTYAVANVVRAQADGRIFVGGNVFQNFDELFPVAFPRGPFLFQRAGLVRLLPGGQPDTFFGGAGVTAAWRGLGGNAYALALQPDGDIVVAGDVQGVPTPPGSDPLSGWSANPTPAVYRFRGGERAYARVMRDATAIEYVDAGSGHYFMTASPKEIAALDTLLYSGAWTRTGLSFRVSAESDAASQPVCRFFSDQSFAPKSSHFYTPYAQECDALKRGSVWLYEGVSFFATLPAITGNNAVCSTDTTPLYRIFNNGIGGAPNHRYTTDRTVRDLMLHDGWIAEGSGADAVAMCALQD